MTEARLTDARLRDLYARGLHTPDERRGCPDADTMLALVRGEGAEEQRLATIDHVMSCEACSREFELLRALGRVNDEGANDVVAPTVITPMRRRASWVRYAPLAIAATILVAVGVRVAARDSGRDVLRGDQATVALVGPQTEIMAGMPVEFTWRGVADALRYELEVLSATGTVAYAATTTDTTATVPGATLLPGDYRWWVRASTGTGDQRASEMRGLRVRRQ